MTEDYLFIFAGTVEQARHFARQQGLYDPKKITYIHDEHQLHGLLGEGRTLWLYGTCYQNKDCYKIIELAKFMGFKVTEV
uniref:Uncharacterized protein n=1 Tax=viral metagenome TaxID=1070528 RepID=A0A6M3XGU8_9ZZZZ